MKTKSIVAVLIAVTFFAFIMLMQAVNSNTYVEVEYNHEEAILEQNAPENTNGTTVFYPKTSEDEYLLSILNPEILEDEYLLAWFLESRRIMRSQAAAIEAYNLITKPFLKITSGSPQMVFPDYFAGGFIEDYTLVVQLTELNQYIIDHYRAIVGIHAPVEFRQVEFSLNQLNIIGEAVVNDIKKLNLNIVSHGIDVKNNLYRIDLYSNDPLSEEFIHRFNIAYEIMPISVGKSFLLILDIWDVHIMPESRQIHPNRAAAIEALSFITNTFLQHKDGIIQIVYPVNFAGAFLDENMLVIQLTDLNQSCIDHYRTIAGMDAPLEFREVEFSIIQLKEIGKAFVNDIKKSNLQVISHGINVRNNLYHIVLSSYDPLLQEIIPGIKPASDFIPLALDEELINSFKAASELMPVTITIGIFAGGRRIGFPAVEVDIFYGFIQMPEFELMRSGNKNIDVEMSVSISTEGVLMYTLYNETPHSFGFIPERVLLYKETPDGFTRLSPINQITLGSANWVWSGSSLTLSIDIGNIFFTDGKITPGVYKFVRVICRMNDPMGGSHLSIIYIANAFTYAVFEILQ